MLRRVKRGAGKAHIKAHGAACATFGVALHALRAGEPVLHVVIRINERNTHLLGEANILVFANFIFLQRVNVRVVEKDSEVDAVGDDLLHQLTRTGGAAGMHEHARLNARDFTRNGQIDMLNHLGCVFRLPHSGGA